jgi:hypothetical protein
MMKKILLSAMALTLLLVACGEEEGVAPNKDYRLVPTSPRAVLINIETAFNRRDIGLLKAMISPNFVFYFDPDDVGQTPPGGSHYVIPESWSYTEFWKAIERLFEGAYRISLTIYAAGVGEPDPEATTYRAENIRLRILVMIDDVNGFLVDRGYCNFEFEKYRSEGGADRWRLTKWWDNTAVPADAKPGLAPTSLGRILSLFR